MKRLFAGFFLIFSLNQLSAQQININPSLIDFHISNVGSSESQAVVITNNSSTKQSFELSLGDWNRKNDGSHEYFKPNTMPYSCADWIKLDKTFIEIEPGKAGEVLISMQAPTNPEELEVMKWAMLFVQSANLKKPVTNGPNEAKASIQEIIRVGVHIYQTPASLTEASASAIGLTQNAKQPKVYDFEVKNTGKVMISGNFHLEITNLATSAETILPVKTFPIFPGGTRIIPFELPADLKPGKYSILGVLDYGENYSLEAVEKNIEIK